MVMAIYPAPKAFLRIVEMKYLELIESDNLVKIGHRHIVGSLIPEIVSSGKDMAGIETNPDPALVLDQRDNGGDFLESPSQMRPLPCRRLKQDHRRAIR